MSTPSKKKQPVKPVEQKARFVIGQKVFIIEWGRSKAGEVYEAEILQIASIKVPLKSDTGKTVGYATAFEYDIRTCDGNYFDVEEYDLHPSITTVSIAFAKKFTHLLK